MYFANEQFMVELCTFISSYAGSSWVMIRTLIFHTPCIRQMLDRSRPAVWGTAGAILLQTAAATQQSVHCMLKLCLTISDYVLHKDEFTWYIPTPDPPAIWNTNRFPEVNICKVLKRSNESSRSWFHKVCSIKLLFSRSSCWKMAKLKTL